MSQRPNGQNLLHKLFQKVIPHISCRDNQNHQPYQGQNLHRRIVLYQKSAPNFQNDDFIDLSLEVFDEWTTIIRW